MKQWRDKNGDEVIQLEAVGHYGWKDRMELVWRPDGTGHVLVRGADAADIELSAEQMGALVAFFDETKAGYR